MPKHSIETVLENVRPSVRREKAYHVGTIPNIEVKLNQNENPFSLPEKLKSDFASIISDVSVNRYPSEFPTDLIDTIARVNNVDSEGIIVGHGSNELSHFLGLCFLEKGKRAVLPRPMFALYETVVRLFGADLIEVPCLQDYAFDLAGLLTAIRDAQPALTVIANPNNPTGLVMNRSSIRQILEATEGIVVVDEAYIEFALEHSALSLMDEFPNLIILRTMSKAFGMAGIRIGYLMGHPELIFEMKKARLPFMIGRHDELCGVAVMNNAELTHQWIREMKEQTTLMWSQVNAIEGVRPLPTMANFFLFETSMEPAGLMNELGSQGIAIRKMSSYPELAAMLRVCAGTPYENQRFVSALKRKFA